MLPKKCQAKNERGDVFRSTLRKPTHPRREKHKQEGKKKRREVESDDGLIDKSTACLGRHRLDDEEGVDQARKKIGNRKKEGLSSRRLTLGYPPQRAEPRQEEKDLRRDRWALVGLDG